MDQSEIRKFTVNVSDERLTRLEMTYIELQLPRKATSTKKDQDTFNLMQDSLEWVMDQTRCATGKKLVSAQDLIKFMQKTQDQPIKSAQAETPAPISDKGEVSAE